MGILYHILKKEKFNFLVLMMKTMQEARTRAKPALLYEKFLTLIFREFGVDMEGESFKKNEAF